ncbi:hypothetical protein CSB37_03840 [bacterium DOLZORAL124_38_8]|nr:MAG: hypothetical protein CSB37_03840 [bacterium DOLZORAL124_38_8]
MKYLLGVLVAVLSLGSVFATGYTSEDDEAYQNSQSGETNEIDYSNYDLYDYNIDCEELLYLHYPFNSSDKNSLLEAVKRCEEEGILAAEKVIKGLQKKLNRTKKEEEVLLDFKEAQEDNYKSVHEFFSSSDFCWDQEKTFAKKLKGDTADFDEALAFLDKFINSARTTVVKKDAEIEKKSIESEYDDYKQKQNQQNTGDESAKEGASQQGSNDDTDVDKNAAAPVEEGANVPVELPEEALRDDEFNGILPSAKKCLKWQAGLCVKWDKGYENTKAGQLGKRIEEGTVTFADIPVFIVKFIDFLTKLVGTVALLFMIYGGFQLMTDQRDDGKSTIKYAIAGVFVAFLSWLAVNIVKSQLTGVDYYGNWVKEELEKK